MKYLSSDLRRPVRIESSDGALVRQDSVELILHEFLARGAAEVIPGRGRDENNNDWLNRHFYGVTRLIAIIASTKLGIKLKPQQVEALVGSYFRARFGRDPCRLSQIPIHYL